MVSPFSINGSSLIVLNILQNTGDIIHSTEDSTDSIAEEFEEKSQKTATAGI